MAPKSLPRLVGAALAAFRRVNEIRVELGETELESWTFLAVSLYCATPTFYKIPVTAELLDHVAKGTYPPTETVVERLVFDLPDPEHAHEGFLADANRETLIRYCGAFIDFMVSPACSTFCTDAECVVECSGCSIGPRMKCLRLTVSCSVR